MTTLGCQADRHHAARAIILRASFKRRYYIAGFEGRHLVYIARGYLCSAGVLTYDRHEAQQFETAREAYDAIRRWRLQLSALGLYEFVGFPEFVRDQDGHEIPRPISLKPRESGVTYNYRPKTSLRSFCCAICLLISQMCCINQNNNFYKLDYALAIFRQQKTNSATTVARITGLP